MCEKDCIFCDCYDEDYGCTMPSIDMWYACSVNGLSSDELEKIFTEEKEKQGE